MNAVFKFCAHILVAPCTKATLKRIWDLADADVDGALTWREFVVAVYLAER
jgi:epidermal growth factor receptor substrate 15